MSEKINPRSGAYRFLVNSYWLLFLAITVILFIGLVLAGALTEALLLDRPVSLGQSRSVELALGIGDDFWTARADLMMVRYGVAGGAILWLGLFTALLVVRLQRRKTKARLCSQIALLDLSDSLALLEFRLIVYPGPPVLLPNIYVTKHSSPDGSVRHNDPLKLRPVQAPVIYNYLTFWAELPVDQKKKEDAESQLPHCTIDVVVTGIDSASEQQFHLVRSYKVPGDVEPGSFPPAVKIDEYAEMMEVIEENLDLILKG